MGNELGREEVPKPNIKIYRQDRLYTIHDTISTREHKSEQRTQTKFVPGVEKKLPS